MQIEWDKIRDCLKKVEEVREYIKLYSEIPMGLVLNLADLHLAIQNLCSMKIEVFEVSFAGEHLRGSTERFANGTAKIYVRADQSDEEKRLAVTKELCHILLDCVDDWSTDGVETISGLLKESQLAMVDGVGHLDPTNPLTSEMLAHVAALELLYPDEFREADITKIENQSKTHQQIAIEHEIPAYAVEQAMERHANLVDIWTEVRNK